MDVYVEEDSNDLAESEKEIQICIYIYSEYDRSTVWACTGDWSLLSG